MEDVVLRRATASDAQAIGAVLVDTHIALLALGDPERLQAGERAVLVDPVPPHHADPSDRVLIAHALQDDLSVLTRDAAFSDYGERLAPSVA